MGIGESSTGAEVARDERRKQDWKVWAGRGGTYMMKVRM